MAATVASLLVGGCGDATMESVIGDPIPCSFRESVVELDEQPDGLGYTPRDVLSRIEGTHTGRVAWVDPCSPDSCQGEHCDPTLEPSTTFSGTETLLTVSISATEQPARALVPEASAAGCKGVVSIPVRMTVTTSDGALDESTETEVSAASGGSPEARAVVSRLDGNGALIREVDGDVSLQLALSAHAGLGDAFDFRAVLTSPERPLVEALLLPDEDCAWAPAETP